jgi:hypothetical protein
MTKIKSMALMLDADSPEGSEAGEMDARSYAGPGQKFWTVSIGRLPRSRVIDLDEFVKYANKLPNAEALAPGASIFVNAEDDQGRYCAELLLLKSPHGESFHPALVRIGQNWLVGVQIAVTASH